MRVEPVFTQLKFVVPVFKKKVSTNKPGSNLSQVSVLILFTERYEKQESLNSACVKMDAEGRGP